MSEKDIISENEVTAGPNLTYQPGDETSGVYSLPDEVIAFILNNNMLSTSDLLHFGLSCKRFYSVMINNNSIWKSRMHNLLPGEVFEVIKSSCEGSWYNEAKIYFILRKSIISEVIQLSPKYYGTFETLNGDNMVEDLTRFTKLAVARNINYYVTIWILCDLIKSAYRYIDNLKSSKKPFTLTEAFHANMVLQYLFHEFLIVKWSQMDKQKEQTPEKVLHFFVQWVDTTTIHLEDDLEDMIKCVVGQVENCLDRNHPLRTVSQLERQSWARGFLNNNKWDSTGNQAVLLAIKYVLYEMKPMVLLPGANLETLDLLKVLTTRTGHAVAVAAIFSAVARRCGVRCVLIAFAHHMFLEWRDDYEAKSFTPAYIVNLSNGMLEMKRQCPFSRGRPQDSSKQYCPHSLLEYVAIKFSESMGAIRNTSTNNIGELYKFLGSEHLHISDHWEEKMFAAVNSGISPINIKYMDTFFLKLLNDMAYMKIMVPTSRQLGRVCLVKQPIEPKPHPSHVRFAVGMVCLHVQMQYVCIILEWDETCRQPTDWQIRMNLASLKYKHAQPFYSVMAVDYSTRYVAQENLRVIKQPHRLSHLEEEIGRFFNHFDGFAYIPNDQKEAEYPQDGPIREMHRTLSYS